MAVEPAFADAEALVEAQWAIGRLTPPVWHPPEGPLLAAGCFVAFARGEQGPGRAGDHAWVGAAIVTEDGAVDRSVVTAGTAGAPYRPGLLALREGQLLLDGLRRLLEEAERAPDVVLIDATGRDHPRRCGMAVHLGALLDLPTVGVTHRLLQARRLEPPPGDERGERGRILAGGEAVAAWVATARGVRPVAVHAAWRTDVDAAVAVGLRTARAARTPEPLRVARQVARQARAATG